MDGQAVCWQHLAERCLYTELDQGPFNELFWSGLPAKTILTLMLRLMAKPASKPMVVKEGEGAAACTQQGPAPLTWGNGKLEQEDKQGKAASPSITYIPCKGNRPHTCTALCICWGVFPSISSSPPPAVFSMGCRVPHCRAANTAIVRALSGTKHSNCLTI